MANSTTARQESPLPNATAGAIILVEFMGLHLHFEPSASKTCSRGKKFVINNSDSPAKGRIRHGATQTHLVYHP
jgi:hypothetical protein